MKFCILKSTLTLLLPCFLWSCVSIDLSKNDVKKAKGVLFQAPQQPFSEVTSQDVDKAWRNNKNGNTISFVSDCENPYDPNLESIEAGVVSGLQDLEKISTQSEMYNDRASRQSIYRGTVDGIPSKVNLMVFKKNNCIYVLSYLALEKNFDQDEQVFSHFLREFRAP